MKLEEIDAPLNLKENRDRKVVLMMVNRLVKALKNGGRVQGRLHKLSLSGGYGFQEIESQLGQLFLDSFHPEIPQIRLGCCPFTEMKRAMKDNDVRS